MDAAVATYPGPTAAYFSMFHSPTSVDSRAVQLGGAMTFFIAVACAVFAGRHVTEWVVSWRTHVCTSSAQYHHVSTAQTLPLFFEDGGNTYHARESSTRVSGWSCAWSCTRLRACVLHPCARV